MNSGLLSCRLCGGAFYSSCAFLCRCARRMHSATPSAEMSSAVRNGAPVCCASARAVTGPMHTHTAPFGAAPQAENHARTPPALANASSSASALGDAAAYSVLYSVYSRTEKP